MNILSYTPFNFIDEFHQKNFFAAASCWLLHREEKETSEHVEHLNSQTNP